MNEEDQDSQERREGRELPLLNKEGDLMYVGVTSAKRLLETGDYTLALLPPWKYREKELEAFVRIVCEIRENNTGKPTMEHEFIKLKLDFERAGLLKDREAEERVKKYRDGHDVYGSS